jgi:hypothetical protein
MSDQTFRSKRLRALLISMSEMGIEYPAPALLTSASRVPPVRDLMCETQAEMDSEDRVSSWIVSCLCMSFG